MLRPALRDKFRLAGAITPRRRAFTHAVTQARLVRKTGFVVYIGAGQTRRAGLDCSGLSCAPGVLPAQFRCGPASSVTRSVLRQQQALNLLVGLYDMRGVLQLFGRVGVGDGNHLHAGGETGGDARL
jgi:hypothetical protein